MTCRWNVTLSLDREIRSTIKDGYRIPFVRDPPTAPFPKHDPILAKGDMDALDQEVSALLTKGSIELATSPGFSSRLFCITKATGGLRPVLNLRPLNAYIAPRHFKMETLGAVTSAIEINDYLTSLDLQDAFHHVLIHPDSRKYLQFRWRGKIYQFKVLPFGLSLAPLVFTKVLRPLIRWARAKGIRIFAYLDDLLIAASSKEQSIRDTALVQAKLQELGFLIKMSKSHLTPTQRLQHLGFIIDTRAMTLSVPGSKIRDIRREASKMINKGSATVRQLSSFIGKTNAMTAAIFPARLRSQHLLQLKNISLTADKQWTDLVQLTQEAKGDLLWWRSSLQTWNGQCWIPPQTAMDVYTDASETGWGIVIGNRSWSGLWSTHQRRLHINVKELLTVYMATDLRECRGKTLNIICDNTSTIAYINRFGGTRSPELLFWAMKLWDGCLRRGTCLKTTYIPSAFSPADAPSRQLTGQLEWSISPSFFSRMDRKWGPHRVDLFASEQNHRLPQFMSWKPCRKAIAWDALQQPWKRLGRVYCCPPWNLIPAVLQKIRQEKVEATVITPFWRSALWFPTIRTMSITPPIPIPREAVIPAPGNAPDILAKNPMWSLTAWNISGKH